VSDLQPLTMSELDSLSTVFFPHRVDIDLQLFSPVSKMANSFDCMSGYFSSGVLRELAHAISFYLLSSDDKKMRFIIGPNISSKDDVEALRSAIYYQQDLVPLLFEDVDLSINNLQSKTVKMLSYLVAVGKIDLKIAVMSNSKGIFHNKYWLFNTSQGNVAIHGSGNSTSAGIGSNSEQFTLTRSWQNSNEEQTFNMFKEEFDRVWSEDDDTVLCTALNIKTMEHISKISDSVQSNSDNLRELTDYIKSIIDDSVAHAVRYPRIPDMLNDAPFDLLDHQKRAIRAWNANEFKGILELATGSGKTITSIYAATKVYQARKKMGAPTILMVSVPYVELAKQWVMNLEVFGMEPIECWDSRHRWTNKLKQNILAFNLGAIDFIGMVVVNKTLSSDHFSTVISPLSPSNIVFIGDECHRHGSEKMSKALPNAFYRMGLSATPFNSDEDDYDSPFPDEARFRLTSYYNRVVDTYTLGDAINDGVLCEYDYHIVPVFLTEQEQEIFEKISLDIARLLAASRSTGLTDQQRSLFKMLAGRRSRLLGGAENKLVALSQTILGIEAENQSHSLFYCGEGSIDKELMYDGVADERNINQVSRVLKSAGWSSTRFTSEESARDRKIIMKDFVDGVVDALVSLKVLDEGVDVPICNKAFILASTRNRRQYVQRRGRVLRKHSTKSKSVIYDFVVLPAGGSKNTASQNLIEAELERVDDFCELAINRRDVENQIDILGMRDE
jgi:superfamily II DNA or RNA helicase